MSAELIRDADLCVKCGICLPHCPTYQKTRDENESPRGRIALMQAWAEGNLPVSGPLDTHLGNCLLCRACERVCPALVPYGRLVDEFRFQTAGVRKDSLALSLVKYAAHNPSLRNGSLWLLDFYRHSGFAGLLRRLNIADALRLTPLQRLILAIPDAHRPQPAGGVPGEARKGRVGLFSGCMGNLLDRETLDAAERMLTSAGYEVYRPAGQTCCGALDLHSGDRQSAVRLEQQNCAAFDAANLAAVIVVASGCGATLQEYGASGFTEQVVDISSFLLRNITPETLNISPLPAKIMVHTPCSLANAMRGESHSVMHLLRHIPEAELLPLPDSLQCCGSAGSYMLDHPNMAQMLLDDILTAILQAQPRYVATSNIGCALHIRAGLKALDADIEVLHPVALLNRQLTLAAK